MMPSDSRPWALVTGAAGGIGSAVCARLAVEPGLSVVGIDRSLPEPSPANWQLKRCDLAEATSRERLLGSLLDKFGPPCYWASCAGLHPRCGLEDYESELFEQVLADNFGHVFWVAQSVVAAMTGTGGGRIVITTSQAGASGGRDALYAASKAACAALAKSIAREYATAGVLCNAVSPGPVDTPMAEAMGARRTYYEEAIPIGRLTDADEVAEVICMLLTSSQEAMTGATVDIDGGLLRR